MWSMGRRRVRFASGLAMVAGLLLAGGCGQDVAASVDPPPCPEDIVADSGNVIGSATGDTASTVKARICTYDYTRDNVFSEVMTDVIVPDDVLNDIVSAVRAGSRDTGLSKPGACREDGGRQYWFFGVTASGEGTVMGATDCAFLTGVPPESAFGKLIA